MADRRARLSESGVYAADGREDEVVRGARRPKLNGLGVYAVAYLVFLYLPVAVLPVFSFNDSQYVTFPLKGFTFKWYYALADNQGLLNGFWNSVKVAVSVSVLSTILGIFAAKAVTRYRMRGRGG